MSDVQTPVENPNAFRLTPSERDELGQVVRNAWVRWAASTANPRDAWLVPWDQLPEADREADRRIADELVAYLRLPGLPFRILDGFINGVGINFAADCINAVSNIETVRSLEGSSVMILCDDPEADTRDRQVAVEVCGDYTDWNPERFYAATWMEALNTAAALARKFSASEDSGE